eukprot:CAMPEP_0176449580 /NCGR_PEP_ID=MMETSP0127-20121128/26564_1 /TAXON_ID=938130 /ORGANISM="Platyophrya macrostoma, Strain WH" /LENGTH=345 /DNA_ID=CAMNT_0017836949 /DNA_START=28 /DNA_END=1065 /DNA_ORIENTATION=-
MSTTEKTPETKPETEQNKATPVFKQAPLTEADVKILQAINEKAKGNLTLKLRLLTLYNYAVIECEQSEHMTRAIDGLDFKYKQLAFPLVERTNDIINGKPLLNLDLYHFEKYATEEELKKKEQLFAEEPKPILNYWLKVLKANGTTGSEIKPHDEGPLKALRTIEYFPSRDLAKPHDFVLKFQFAQNEYFENTELIKYFQMVNDHEAVLTECTPISWKSGKDFTKRHIQKKQSNKKTGKSRTIDQVVYDSFFTFFRSIEGSAVKNSKDNNVEELDDLERHVEIALAIIDEILPYSNEYYLGVRSERTQDKFGFGEIKEEVEGENEEADKIPKKQGDENKEHKKTG